MQRDHAEKTKFYLAAHTMEITHCTLIDSDGDFNT